MWTRRLASALLALSLGGTILSVACGPAAEPTATAATQATATTVRQPTATTAVQSTATRPAGTAPAGATATVAEAKVRPIPVLGMPPANPNAQKGGTFRWLASADPANFGIWDSANGTTLQLSVPTTDSLLDRNEYEEGKNEQILGNIAYDWWTDQAGTTWTFKLKEGLKYTDGVALTCADWEWSLESIRDVRDSKGSQLPVSPRAAWLRRATNISCPDANTLQIKTDGPLPSLPATLAVSSFSVLPKHIYEGKLDTYNRNPIEVGVGPFTYVKYVPTEIYVLKRNPNYWNQPYPYIDALEVPNLGSQTSVNAAFSVGRGEYASNIAKASRDRLETEGKIIVQGRISSDGFLSVQANWTKKPWSDKRFSLALRCAIDSEKVINTASSGEGFEGPAAPLKETPGGPAWGISLAEWKALGPCFGPTKETNMDQRRQMARDLLTQMGFSATNPAKVKAVWPDSASSKDSWVPVVEDLKAVGIEVTTEYLNTAKIYPKFQALEFDIGTPAGFVTSRRDPDHWFYEQFYSTSARNYGQYVNAEVDVLIDQQSREVDPVRRVNIIKQVIIGLEKDQAKVILRHSYSARTFAAWVKDAFWGEPSNSQNTSAKFLRIWLDQAKMKQVLG